MRKSLIIIHYKLPRRLLPESGPAKIDKTVSILARMEKYIDELAASVSDMKRLLINMAEDDAEKVKKEFLDETTKLAREKLAIIEKEARTEAETILIRSEEEIKALRIRIEQAFDKAVDIVVKTVLGEQP
jgi:vacuolar-type H+-ATPase subunit H